MSLPPDNNFSVWRMKGGGWFNAEAAVASFKVNFPLLSWAAQTAQTAEFTFKNVAYRPTVYRTGILL